MRNLKRWKRLMAVTMCSAMMLSVPMGVSADESLTMSEPTVEETSKTETIEEKESGEPTDESGVASSETSGAETSVDKNQLETEIKTPEETEKKEVEPKSTIEGTDIQKKEGDVLPTVEPMTIDFEIDKVVEIPVTMGSGKYASTGIAVELPERERIVSGIYDDEKGVVRLSLGVKFDDMEEDLLSGDYTLNIKFYEGNKLVHVNSDVKIHIPIDSKIPVLIPADYKVDGSDDVTYHFQDGTGYFEITKIKHLASNENPYLRFEGSSAMHYDLKAGTITIKGDYIRNNLVSPTSKYSLYASIDVIGGGVIRWIGDENEEWKFQYEKKEIPAGMPQLIDTNCSFDGTKDLVLNFKDGVGDYKIKDVIKLTFWSENNQQAEGMNNFWISKTPSGGEYVFEDDSEAFVANIEKGQVTFAAFALSPIVYGSGYGFKNPYRGAMFCEFENGKTGYIYSNEQGAWDVTLLEASPEAVWSHNEYLGEDGKISKARMQELVEINKTRDIIIKTECGLSYVFKKGDFKLVDGKDEYDFGVILNEDFSKSRINNSKVTSDDYAKGINYNYSGQLPGKAEITIPVDRKWDGKELNYYLLNSDGSLSDTGLAVTVEKGKCKISQSHCSDYVLLAKSPKEIGVTKAQKPSDENNGTQKPSDSNNELVGDNKTSDTNTKGQVAKTNTTSPKTGDTTTVLLFVFLCMGALVVGTGAIAIRRKSN